MVKLILWHPTFLNDQRLFKVHNAGCEHFTLYKTIRRVIMIILANPPERGKQPSRYNFPYVSTSGRTFSTMLICYRLRGTKLLVYYFTSRFLDLDHFWWNFPHYGNRFWILVELRHHRRTKSVRFSRALTFVTSLETLGWEGVLGKTMRILSRKLSNCEFLPWRLRSLGRC
jgi:hypothetical protein